MVTNENQKSILPKHKFNLCLTGNGYFVKTQREPYHATVIQPCKFHAKTESHKEQNKVDILYTLDVLFKIFYKLYMFDLSSL